nr:hypothetical protein [Tanacetum cinerariifolium]
MTKVIKGEFKTLETLKINDVSLTCNTSLEIFHDEFNRLSNMDDDFFTYKVEIARIANVPCDLNRDDDSEQQMSQEFDNDMEGDDEVELTDEESSNSNDEREVAGIFRIKTNVFDFKTPLCSNFKEFNYLLQIDPDVLTKDIEGFKTYKEYKDDWIYVWNKYVPWVHEKPWTDTGDSELKEEALRNKAIMEVLINEDIESNNEDDEERCELFDDALQELPVFTVRRFEIIKYSFGQDEEYIAVKEDK